MTFLLEKTRVKGGEKITQQDGLVNWNVRENIPVLA